jgi:hypothetical protein
MSELPDLFVVAPIVDGLPVIDGGSQDRARGSSDGLPVVDGSGSQDCARGSSDGLPVLGHVSGSSDGLPVLDGVPVTICAGSCDSGLPDLDGEPPVPPLPPVIDGRHTKKPKLREREHMRIEALADIPSVAERFGRDLVKVPDEWLDTKLAESKLMELGVTLSSKILLFEVFAGCAHLTQAALKAGWQACPPVDIDVALGTVSGTAHGRGPDLLSPDGRRLLWNIIAAFRPAWVHLAFPCTFWSPMAHFTRKRTREQDEESRLTSLAFIVLARQVAIYQQSQGRHTSFEQPPACVSWSLDIVRDIVTSGNMVKIVTDVCCWGSVDPGNGLPYKKPLALCSTVDLSELVRRCKKRHMIHQRVHQTVTSGDRKGTLRTKVSGEYPPELCSEWVRIMAATVEL